jgi:hydroxymethylpyrimidine pyrophosphatase-like HAD family hydrolase
LQPRRALVLDLDYTLLHLEATPSAIEVPGRTRSAYLAAETVDALSDLRERYDTFLATARSWHGTRPVVEGLARRGVTVTGVVLEDGALLGPPGEHRPLEPGRDWEGLRRALGAALPDLPFSWQEDFEACLVARSETPAEAETLLAGLGGEALRLDPTLRCFRDGRKVYVTGAGADKWTALVALLGDRAEGAVGIGDGANDVCWLGRVATPCTFAGVTPDLVALVRERGGLVSEDAGHAGILGLLRGLSPPTAAPQRT